MAAALMVPAILSVALAQPTEAVRFPRCQGVPATMVAVPGGATTNGTSGDDAIYGINGADIIYGNGGSDLICGPGGNDIIYEFLPDAALSPTNCADSVDLDSYYTRPASTRDRAMTSSVDRIRVWAATGTCSHRAVMTLSDMPSVSTRICLAGREKTSWAGH